MKEQEVSTSGAVTAGVLLFGGIAALIWGFPGFVIGSVLGVMLMLAAAKEQEKQRNAKARKAEVAPAGAPPSQRSPPVKTPEPSEAPDRRTNVPDLMHQREYEDAVVTLLAGCMVADGKVQQSEASMAASLIRNDDLLADKKGIMQKINAKARELYAARKESNAAFNLRISTDLDRLSHLRDPNLKERLALILDGMLEAVESGKSPDTEGFRKRVLGKLKSVAPSDSKREAAEQYILNSGDRQAIGVLQQMRSDPASYQDRLRQGASGNTVLRTALGVFTGFIAADLVTTAIHQYQLQQALQAFEAELSSTGEFDWSGTDSGGEPSATYTTAEDVPESACQDDNIDVASDESEEIDGDMSSDDFDLSV